MARNTVYFTLLLFFLSIQNINAVQKKNELFFEHLSVKDGLSQITVTAIAQDSRGYMWFGTRDGLNRYNGREFKIYKHNPNDITSISDSYIRCISEDSQKRLWIGTTNGLNMFESKTNTFERYYIKSKERLFYQNEINCILIDAKEDIWVGTYNGLFKLDKVQNKLIKVKSITDRIYCLNITGNKLLLGTLKGLVTYDILNSKTERLLLFSDENKQGNNAIASIIRDSKGQLWIASKKKGVGRYNQRTKQLDEVYSSENNKLSNDEIRDIKEDRNGNILIGTYDGLNVLNPQTKHIQFYNQNSKEEGSLSHYAVESICCDNAGTIWVGTYNGGANYHHIQSGRFRYYNPGAYINMPGIMGPIQEDESGLWIGTEGNLIYFDFKKQSFHDYPPEKWNHTFKDFNIKCSLIKDGHLYFGVYTGWLYDFDIKTKTYKNRIYNDGGAIYSIIEDLKSNTLLGTYSQEGLKTLKKNMLPTYYLPTTSGGFNVEQISCLLQDGENSLFIGTRANGLFHYHDQQVDKYSINDGKYTIAGNKIAILYKDNRDRVWVGTSDGGLCVIDKKESTIHTLTENDGLKDDKICGITQDKDLRMWVTTRTGISEIDHNISVIKTYDYSSGIRVLEFSQNSMLTASDSTIYVGGDNGFISFNPNNLISNEFIPPIVIDNILINNKPVAFDQNNPIELNLSYDEANIAIEYSALNYIYPKQNKYAYKLDGVDKEWNYVDNVRMVNYANLQPGDYVFKVIGSNNDDVWNEVGASIHIRIAPPFWLSIWAYLLYIIIILMIIYSIIHYFKVKNNLNNQMLLKQEQETFHIARINLFTNFSHELRTPLSLIISPLEDVLEKKDLSASVTDTLGLIHQNAKKMLQIVNELIDFRKKESGLMTIKVAAGDFGKFTEEIIIAFNELAKSKDIDLIFDNRIGELEVWYDRFLFEKVFFNLLSNAFKHTYQNDTIAVCLRIATLEEKSEWLSDKKFTNLYPDATDYLKIEVEDTGEGINDSEREKIFDPFYQSIVNKQGSLNSSGIGLSLSKGIVEMHHGVIWATNKPSGGAVFHIVLPLGNKHFNAAEIIEDYKDSENIKRYTSFNESEINEEDYKIPSELQKKYTILIVEDNKELRNYIKQHISKYYKVLEAVNGKEGFSIAVDHVPDLIISDIMMPEVDGLKMTHQLKEDARSSHIPIILLTARTSVIQMKEGLEFGADDYITKPFNSSVLLLKIKNIIMSRENLKNLYGKGFALENMGVEIISTEDRFMQKLCEVVEKNISEPNLNIEKFCAEIGMSRANLYRRIKATTNLSPLEYVKTIRLQVASKMLKDTDLSVTEISEKVGFNSLINFSASFRKHYGLSPTKYASANKSDNSGNNKSEEQK